MAKLKALSQAVKTLTNPVTKARNKASAKAFEKAAGKKKAKLSQAAQDILSKGLRAAKKKHSAKTISNARREINEFSKLKYTPRTYAPYKAKGKKSARQRRLEEQTPGRSPSEKIYEDEYPIELELEFAKGGKVSKRSKPRGVGIAKRGFGRAAR
tara:strand:- start:2340 stop:2804 length:465 start_codon:yes stop_codon:yes gene_type:complete